MPSPNGQKRLNLVADFETTTDPEDCRVWLWGTCDIYDPDNIVYGIDMDSFIREVQRYSAHIYFHNLAFDGSFILDWLLNNGFRHTDGTLRKGQFSTLISMQGKFYSIAVRFRNGNRVEFRDSLKKLPMSVSNVAKAFKLDEEKLDIDYHAARPIGYEPSEEEIDYLINDLVIVAKALRQQFDTGMTRLTVGSDSLGEFKKLMGKKLFERMFPVLPMTMDAQIREAYRGGFTYVDDRHKAKIIGAGRVYDVNSLYPSVMYDRPMPYGEPIFFPGAPKPIDGYPLYIVNLTFSATLKPNHIPCIQVKGTPFFTATEYQKEIVEPVTMTCTNVDLALWMDHYDMDILSWNGGWYFHSISGVFDEYIDKWMDVKANSDGGMRTIAKLHLNSLYGKFATNPNVTPKIPVLGDDGVVKLVMGDEETRSPVYTAVGVFITAYARDVTIRAAQTHYDSFVYADTDSLHLLTHDDPVTLDIDPVKLGAWKRETVFDQAIYVRAKCYCERLPDGSFVTHIAGLPDTIAERVTFDDFYDGNVMMGKLLPKRVKGGIVLTDVGFTLNMN